MAGKTPCVLGCPEYGSRLIMLKYLYKYHLPQNVSGRRPILRMMTAHVTESRRQPQARSGQSRKRPPANDFKGSGAAYVTRTRDPIITNDVLYQLS